MFTGEASVHCTLCTVQPIPHHSHLLEGLLEYKQTEIAKYVHLYMYMNMRVECELSLIWGQLQNQILHFRGPLYA